MRALSPSGFIHSAIVSAGEQRGRRKSVKLLLKGEKKSFFRVEFRHPVGAVSGLWLRSLCAVLERVQSRL
jgi:hypothetical protein